MHYRLLDAESNPVSSTVYRSIKSARKHATNGAKIWAFATRSAALSLNKERLEVTTSEAPTLITRALIQSFIEHHQTAQDVKYPPTHASSRRQLEARYNWTLFGFDDLGRAITAQQNMSVSCKWVSYSCPIQINGRRSNIRGLEKSLS